MAFSFNVPPIFGNFTLYILLVFVASLLIAGIIILINSIVCNTGSAAGGSAYEHFENNEAVSAGDGFYAACKDRIAKIQKAKTLIESLLTDIGDAADETCSIMKIVQEKYVQSAAAPSDDAEAQLPENVRIARRNERMVRAEKRFADEKRAFAVIGNRPPVLECFAVSQEQINNAETELANEVETFIQLLDNAEVKMAITKSAQIESSLGFNAKYINKGLEALSPNEGFASALRGPELLAKADELLGKAARINDDLAKLKREIATQKQAVRTMNMKESNLSSGKILQSDIKV